MWGSASTCQQPPWMAVDVSTHSAVTGVLNRKKKPSEKLNELRVSSAHRCSYTFISCLFCLTRAPLFLKVDNVVGGCRRLTVKELGGGSASLSSAAFVFVMMSWRPLFVITNFLCPCTDALSARSPSCGEEMRRRDDRIIYTTDLLRLSTPSFLFHLFVQCARSGS